MVPSLLLYYRGTSPSVKSRSRQGICFCAQVVPARGNSIAARAILPCTGNLSAGRCLCNCCERSTQVCLMLIFGTQAFFTYIIVPARQLWLKNSLLLNCFFSTFRYRSINVKNLRPLEFVISGFSMTSSLQSGFQRTRICVKQAFIPNPSPSTLQIGRGTQLFRHSVDDIFLNTFFHT